MPAMEEAQFKQQIKDGAFPRVCLLYGSEGYLKQYYADLLPKKCVTPGMEGFNLKKYDYADGTPLSTVLDAAQTLPAFGGSMCIVAHDYPLDALSADDKAALDSYLADAPESTVLVFWQDTAEINPKKNAKWRGVLAAVNKAGVTVCLNRLDRVALCKLLMRGAQKRGCTLSRENADFLSETAGNDLHLLLGELEKLCNYKETGEITRADIEAVVTKSLEANIFDLSRALTSGNCSRALEILEKLLREKEKPELILGTLASSFIDMYRVKTAVTAGEKTDAAAKYFDYKGKEFRLRNAARDAAKLDIRQLRGCLDDLNAADRELKSGLLNPQTTLERLLVQLAGAKAR